MLPLIVSALLLSITSHVESTDTVDTTYHPEAGGWLKLHKAAVNWTGAFLQCHNEGAVLASPLTRELREAMELHINDNDNSLLYFIGANSKFTPRQYVSIEGVPLANMPIGDMYQMLDTEHGECLSTDGYNISVVPCSNRQPYLCYTKKDGRKLTECGTFDKEYRLVTSTGSCYKVHREQRSWSLANSACVSEGGYLAIVNNVEEANIIKDMIPKMDVAWSSSRDWEGLYIGLRDWIGDGTWLTSHGEEFAQGFNMWDEDQPDSTDSSHCGVINRRGKLDNIPCTELSPYICEKDPKNIRYLSENNKEQNGGL